MLRTRKSKKKKEFDSEFDITPMIDVVLLLLIFFMVSARLAPEEFTNLPMAQNGEMATQSDAVVIQVRIGDGGGAVISNLKGDVFAGTSEEISEKIAEYISSEFESSQKNFLLIQGEPGVKTSVIADIRRAAGSVMDEDKKIMIAVRH